MGLLQDWQKIAYDEKVDKGDLGRFWDRYFELEKGIYEQLLSNPEEVVEGTVKDLAKKYDVDIMSMVGFLDGIQESLIEPNDLDNLKEDSHVSLAFDNERLYRNMVDAHAEWLYELPQWKEIYSEEKLHELFVDQRKANTVVKEKKIYPNDPCPCGSGKKYKKCCGRNV